MKKYQNFLSEIFHFLVVKFSVYLNRHVFVMADFSTQLRDKILGGMAYSVDLIDLQFDLSCIVPTAYSFVEKYSYYVDSSSYLKLR